MRWLVAGLAILMAVAAVSGQQRTEFSRAEIAAKFERMGSAKRTMRLAGVIRMEDGSALPQDLKVRVGISPTNIFLRSPGYLMVPVKDARFSIDVPNEHILLLVRSAKTAPVFQRLVWRPDAPLDAMTVMLRKGFEAKIRVVDEAGKGIGGARVYRAAAEAGSLPMQNVSPEVWTADHEGLVRIPSCDDTPRLFEFVADGFGRVGRMTAPNTQWPRMELSENSETRVMLRKTRPAVIEVIGEGGLRMAGANVLLHSFWTDPSPVLRWSDLGVPLKTDSKGRLVLSTMPEGVTLSVLAGTKGWGCDSDRWFVRAGAHEKVEVRRTGPPNYERSWWMYERLGRHVFPASRPQYRSLEVTLVPPAGGDEAIGRIMLPRGHQSLGTSTWVYSTPAFAPIANNRGKILAEENERIGFDGIDYACDPVRVPVREPGKPWHTTLHLREAGVIYGTLRGPTARPISGQFFIVGAEKDDVLPESETWRRRVIGDDGRFVLPALPLDAALAIQCVGSGDGVCGLSFRTMTLTRKDRYRRLDVALAKGVKVRGKVSDGEQPAVGAIVQVKTTLPDSGVATVTYGSVTDDFGDFVVENVPHVEGAKYELTAELTRHGKQPERLSAKQTLQHGSLDRAQVVRLEKE